MLRRTFVGLVTGAALVTPVGLLGPASAAPSEPPSGGEPARAVTLHYDASRATHDSRAIRVGARNWNNSLENVRLLPADGKPADITIVADPGWPRAQIGPVQPGGNVRIWYGRQAVDEGYDPARIAAHEMGHSLGLPDAKPGPCSSLMSGSTGGVECTNATPNAAEAAQVDQIYAQQAAPSATGGIVIEMP